MFAQNEKRALETSDDENQPKSSKIQKVDNSKVSKSSESSQEEISFIFEGTDLLAIKGTTVNRYAVAVAKKLWPEPARESESLWYRRIIQWPQKASKKGMSRPAFRGAKNEQKIFLLCQAVRRKFPNISPSEWPMTWDTIV